MSETMFAVLVTAFVVALGLLIIGLLGLLAILSRMFFKGKVSKAGVEVTVSEPVKVTAAAAPAAQKEPLPKAGNAKTSTRSPSKATKSSAS